MYINDLISDIMIFYIIRENIFAVMLQIVKWILKFSHWISETIATSLGLNLLIHVPYVDYDDALFLKLIIQCIVIIHKWIHVYVCVTM